MRRGGIGKGSSIWACIYFVSLFINQTCSANQYKVGIAPQFSAQVLQQVWLPILADLQRRTDHTFVLSGSHNNPEFEKQVLMGKFDFAYVNPYYYLMGARSQGYIPLVRDIASKLHGIVVVRKDSSYTDVQQLHDQKIAFPSPNALGASLVVRSLLVNKFKIKFEPVYVKSHNSVYLNVVTGRTAAGGGVIQSYEKMPAEVRDQLRIIYVTPGVTPHPLIAHPRVPESMRVAVQQAFLAMAQNEAGRNRLKQIPILAIGTAQVKDYQELRGMGLEEFYVVE